MGAMKRFRSHWHQYSRTIREWPHRARHGWAPSDTWDFDHYLARLLGEGLGYMARHSHGYPAGFTVESWEAELRKLSESLLTYHYNQWTADNSPGIHEEAKAAIARLSELWGHLWD